MSVPSISRDEVALEVRLKDSKCIICRLLYLLQWQLVYNAFKWSKNFSRCNKQPLRSTASSTNHKERSSSSFANISNFPSFQWIRLFVEIWQS